MARQRNSPIGASTPQRLGIILGLPGPMHQAAQSMLDKFFPKWRFICTRFPEAYEKIYSYDNPILEAMREACLFASANSHLPLPRPAQIVVFYVRCGNVSPILNAFGYSAILVPLDIADWKWPKGRHWRGDPDVVLPLLRIGVSHLDLGDANNLRLRLERVSAGDPLLLPPRNYRLEGGTYLSSQFDESITSDFMSLNVIDVATLQEFNQQNFGKYFSKVGANKSTFRVDDRGLIFATSPHGQHGNAWKINLDSMTSLQDYRHLLEGLFRFGTPLRTGFQHDVQWQNRDLKQEAFWCNERNSFIKVDGSHANIFANDRVR